MCGLYLRSMQCKFNNAIEASRRVEEDNTSDVVCAVYTARQKHRQLATTSCKSPSSASNSTKTYYFKLFTLKISDVK